MPESTSLDFDDRLSPWALTSSEIHASRARIVAAADEARRRLERDLHDGAQHRLVLAALKLQEALTKARGTPAEQLVAEGFQQLQQALAALRDLARGLHPIALNERGLATALEDLIAASPVPVELRVTQGRFAPAEETAIYFTVAEALTNVAKHAHATLARVHVDIHDGALIAQVEDDGIGGARATAGSGLSGLRDRLNALGGTLSIGSPPAGGTSIHARIPLRASSA